jgi:hypothetical protein
MGDVDNLLMTGCEVKSTGVTMRGVNVPTRTWPLDFKNSSYCNIRDNKIYYCVGRFGANGCHHAIFENNTFIRDGNHQSEDETGGLHFDYAVDIVIQKNRFLVTGDPVENRNQGETILSQGGGAHQRTLGVVTEATATSLMDVKQEWQDFTDRVSTEWERAAHPANYTIAIVDGAGTGQWRTVTWNNDTVLTVDRPWDVIPQPGSKYVILQWSVRKGLIKDNVLKDNHQGIMLYCGGTDVVIAGNELLNSGGISVRADQRMQFKSYALAWNISMVDNKAINTNGLRSAHVALSHLKVKNDNNEIFGTGTIGIEMRRNLVQAFVPNVNKAGGSSGIRPEGFINCVECGKPDGSPCDFNKIAIVGTIMEHNTAIHTEDAYLISGGACNTVIIPGKTEKAGNLLKDTGAKDSYILTNQ